MSSALYLHNFSDSGKIKQKALESPIVTPGESTPESIGPLTYSEISENSCEFITFINYSAFLTLDDKDLELTRVFSFPSKEVNFRKIYENFKVRSAITIQRFFRRKSREKKLKNATKTIFMISSHQKARTCLTKLGHWAELAEKSAILIQKHWKKYQNFYKNRSMLKKNLRESISVSNKIAKFTNYFEIVSSKNFSEKNSPERTILDFYSKKKSEKWQKSKAMNDFISSPCSDSSDTIETYSSTIMLDLSESRSFRNILEFGVNDSEILKEKMNPGSLIMKKPFKVRTKRNQRFNNSDFFKNFCLDIEAFNADWKIHEKSCIPQLKKNSIFFTEIELNKTKSLLASEYEELIK